MGSKRKKKEKAKDFVKQKLKVGKTAAKPDNHTDTSFKAKRIHIATQSISTRGLSASTSAPSKNADGNLETRSVVSSASNEAEINRLLLLVKHHSANTRKEVLLQLIPLLPSNPTPYRAIMTSLIPMMLDQTLDVRKTLVQVFQSVATRQKGILDLHIRSYVLFVHSAMTHIMPEIRSTSTLFLEVVVENAPMSLARSHFIKTMQLFFSLMSWNLNPSAKGSLAVSTSSAIGGVTKRARAVHIRVLTKFLSASLFPEALDQAKNETQCFTIHPQTIRYIMPITTQPYSALKLFVKDVKRSSETDSESANGAAATKKLDDGKFTILDLNTLSSEDYDTRRKIIVDIFLNPMTKGLDLLIKEGGEVGKEAKACLAVLDRIQE